MCIQPTIAVLDVLRAGSVFGLWALLLLLFLQLFFGLPFAEETGMRWRNTSTNVYNTSYPMNAVPLMMPHWEQMFKSHQMYSVIQGTGRGRDGSGGVCRGEGGRGC